MSGDTDGRLATELVTAIREAAIQLEHDGRPEPAIRLLKDVLRLGDARLPTVDTTRLRAALAGMLWKRGRMEKARVLATDAVKLAEEVGNPEALSEALFALGEVTYIEAAYMGRGTIDEALELHLRALDLRCEMGDRRGESLSLARIGVIHERRDEHDRAQARYEQALRIAEEIDFPGGTFRPLVHIAVAKDRGGDLPGALVEHRKSLAAARRARAAYALTFALSNVAVTAHRLDGKLDSALELLDEAEGLAREIDAKLSLCRVPLMRGDVYGAAGLEEEARRAYEASIRAAEAAGFLPLVEYVNERLARLGETDD